MVTLLGFDLAALLSGFALVENVVSWPGLGQLMLQAMVGMDMTLSMAGLMIGATMLLVGNLLADLLLAAVDPRIKLEA
ncbi:Dipeptide transport system permease protein DppB [compost metagenome]